LGESNTRYRKLLCPTDGGGQLRPASQPAEKDDFRPFSTCFPLPICCVFFANTQTPGPYIVVVQRPLIIKRAPLIWKRMLSDKTTATDNPVLLLIALYQFLMLLPRPPFINLCPE
jgi:hypothetical protein